MSLYILVACKRWRIENIDLLGIFIILFRCRVRREGKERRKKLAERLTPRPKTKVEVCDDDDEMVEDEEGADTNKQSQINKGMLPNDIVNLLAAREKYALQLSCLYLQMCWFIL